MRKEAALIKMFRGLVDLIADEYSRNSEFASKLDSLLSELPERKASRRKSAVSKISAKDLPDIHAELNARGETDFVLWLKDQPIPILRAIIRKQDMDPTRRTSKWKDVEKLAGFITDSLRGRLSRGAAFIGRGLTE